MRNFLNKLLIVWCLLPVNKLLAQAQGFTPLVLTSMCSENPSQMVRWKIENPNNYNVTYTWKIVDGGPNAPSSLQSPEPFISLPGANYIYVTRWSTGNNVMVIYVNNTEQPAGRKAAGNTVCSTFHTYLTCVKKIDQCTMQATFGYNNPNSNTTFTIPLGSNNEITNGDVFSGVPDTVFPPGNFQEAFKIRYPCTDTIRWVLNGPFGSKTVYSTNTFDSTCQNIVKIFVNCIDRLADGSYSASFGYENTGDDTVVISDPSKNYVEGDIISATPVTVFQPGLHKSAFTAYFSNDDIKWNIITLEGIKRTTTACIDYAGRCVKPLKNFVTCIRQKEDGIFSAVFGYDNQDTIPVSIAMGGGKNYLINEEAGQFPITVFEPGKHDSAFAADFLVEPVKWALLGPEGIMHYAIAGEKYCKLCDSMPPINLPLNSQLRLSPNPVYNLVTLVPLEQITTVARVVVYDCTGKKMREKNFTPDELLTMDLTGLKKGVYVIRLITGEKALLQRFMKM